MPIIVRPKSENLTNMVSYKIILTLRLLFGHYHDVNKSKFVNYLAKIYCVLFCCINMIIYYFTMPKDFFKIRNMFNAKIFVFMSFIFNTVSSLVFGDKYFVQYCSTIETNDAIMGFRTPLITKSITIVFIITILLRVALCCLSYIVMGTPLLLVVVTALMMISLDLNHLHAAWILCLFYSRISLLAGFFKNIYVPINIDSNRNGARVCVQNIRKGLHNYNALMDDVQYFNKPLQCLLIAALLACLPKTILFMYVIAFTYILNEESGKMMYHICVLTHVIYLLSLPMVITQAIMSEVDKIITILSKKLLRSSDECVRSELEAALEYIKLRPFKYVVCRVITVDISLLYTIVSVCLTYAIVMMQFTRFTG